MTIQFSGPDSIETGNVSADTRSSYQPPWEPGNVFSYPASKAQLGLLYPDLANTQLSSDIYFSTGDNPTTFQASWSQSDEQGKSVSTTNNFSFDVSQSVVAGTGLTGVVQQKYKGSVSVSGSFGFSTLQNNTASMQNTDGIAVQATARFLNPGLYKYSVLPVIMSSPPPAGVGDSSQPPAGDLKPFGPLQSAFVAAPLKSDQGSWWTGNTSPYTKAPDVALNHGGRWLTTQPSLSGTLPSNCLNYGSGASDINCVDIAPPTLDDPWNSQYLWMKGFFITRADHPGAGPQIQFVTAGEKLDLGVRVYNYSLAEMPQATTVHVRFYGSIWNTSRKVPSSSFLIDEVTSDVIPPFNDDPQAPLNWKVVHTTFDTTAYSGQSVAFWVVVWMQDQSGNLVPEIPGHGLTSVPGPLAALP